MPVGSPAILRLHLSISPCQLPPPAQVPKRLKVLKGQRQRSKTSSFGSFRPLTSLRSFLPPHVGQPHTRRRALAQDVAPEDEQLGRAASGLGVELAGPFDQA